MLCWSDVVWCFGGQGEAAQHGQASVGLAARVAAPAARNATLESGRAAHDAASAARNATPESASGERHWAAGTTD